MFEIKINVKSKNSNMSQWVKASLLRNYDNEESLSQCLEITCKELGLTYLIGQDSIIYFKDEVKSC